MKTSKLGSLAALMDEAEAPVGEQEIDLELIHEDPDQPRKDMDPVALKDLAASIKAQGVVQPIVVRVHPDLPERYMIVAGERRWRASKLADKTTIPAVVRELGDETIRAMQIIENVQREELRPMQEAAAVEKLVVMLGGRAKAAAEALGKSAAWVSKRRKLLKLPEAVQRYADRPEATRDVELLAQLGDLYGLSEGLALSMMRSPEGVSRERVANALVRLKAPAAPSPSHPQSPQNEPVDPKDAGPTRSAESHENVRGQEEGDLEQERQRPRARPSKPLADEPAPITRPVVLVQHEGADAVLVLTQAAEAGRVWVQYPGSDEQALVLAESLVVIGVVQGRG